MGKDAGLNLTSNDDFFSHPTLKGYYRSHVKRVLNRVNTITNITYKDDPTIFGWELMNEPPCESDPTGDTLQGWIEEMAVFVKSSIWWRLEWKVSADPRPRIRCTTTPTHTLNKLVRTSSATTKYLELILLQFISTQILGFPKQSRIHIEFTKSWMQAHIDDAENFLGMPVVFSEFGVSRKDPGYNETYHARLINSVYQSVLNSTKKGGGGCGTLMWQLFPEGTDYMDDGYAVVLSENPSLSNIISLQSTRLKIFNSLCSWKCRWSCKKKHAFHFDEVN